ncbi:RNA polymerase sigma factor [Paraliomyxa miuraensis]|uniref:RNA polymerase sigma factor n=1 Tax=Paraliomyxa miuraensis TaxID=376150 RepID=UPI00224FC480|nr:RNA polymerase sigma factor [Paraliomyxa miuraensis]MCX4240965.1 RNA polymerase sigma factor [Paraliomyxa miuraensis]
MSGSDAELLDAWAAGDARAGSRLFNRYFLPISRFFINKVPEDHDDLIQETFVACLRSRERLRDKASFRAFLFAVATNVLRMHFRRRRVHDPIEALESCSAQDLSPGPSSVLRVKEEEQALLDALREIPLALQIVMELYYWEDLRTHEIANVVDLPTGTVRSHLRRGRQLLEQALAWTKLDAVGLDQRASSLRTAVTRSCA